MNLEDVKAAFQSAYKPSPREGLSTETLIQGGELHVQVRWQDVDELRGFDVVAMPVEGEEKSAEEVGQDIAQVVEQELAYGQLPARDESGEFKRIVV